MKVALVTGSSSGIGLHTSLALARAGYTTYATMRDVSKAAPLLKEPGVRVAALDVGSPESIKDAVSDITRECGRLDVLINNAGYGQFGVLEETGIQEFRDQFEINFFGVVALIQEVLPTMRRQGSGRIVNIGSVAGRMGLPCSPAYISSKFALEGVTECLRYELDPFGIQVTIIEPGVVKTSFFKSMRMPRSSTGAYDKITTHIMNGLQMMAQMGADPQSVVGVVMEALNAKEMLPRYVAGQDAAMFLEAKRSRSDMEFEKYMKKEMFPAD